MANPIITRIQVENNDVVSFLNGTTPPYTYVRSMSQILPQNPTYISYRYDSITISQVGGEAFTFTVYTITQVGGNSFTALNFQDPATAVQAKTVEIYRLLVTSIFKGCCECGNTEPECSIQYTYGNSGISGQFDYTFGYPGLIRFSYTTGNNQDFSNFFPIVQDGSWVFLFSKTDPTVYAILQLSNFQNAGGACSFDAIELNANGTPFVEGTQFCVDFTSVGGSLVQGWQDTLNINPNLNQDNTVDGGGYDFVFDNNSSFTINGPGGSFEVDAFGPSMNAGSQQILVTAGYIDINTPAIGSASPGWVLTLTASGHVEYAPAATGTVSSVGVSAGTGISASVANPTTTPVITITNTAPDQIVSITGGTGISTSGTYPNFTITNTAPGVTYTVDNGLSPQTTPTSNPNNFQLGGTLVKDTLIDTASQYLKVSGALASSNGLFRVEATGSAPFHAAAYFRMNTSGVAVWATSDGTGVYGTGNGAGVEGISAAGFGGNFQSTSSPGVNAVSVTNVAIKLSNSAATGNDVQPISSAFRLTSGTSTDGIGLSYDLYVQDASNLTSITNKIISKWTTANSSTRTSQFEIQGVNSAAAPATYFTLKGTGQLQLNNYITSTAFASASGSSIGVLNVDNTGNLFVGTAGSTGTVTSVGLSMPSAFTVTNSPVISSGTLTVTGSGTSAQYIDGTGALRTFPTIPSPNVYTVNNGLTESPSNNFQLGGTLLTTTTIVSNNYPLRITGNVPQSAGASFYVENTDPGYFHGAIHGKATGSYGSTAIYGETDDGTGVTGSSTNGVAFVGTSVNNYAGSFSTFNYFAAVFARKASSGSTVSPTLLIQNESTSAISNGIGGSIMYQVQANGGADFSHELVSKWTDATYATRTSQFEIKGQKNATGLQTYLTVKGGGQLQLNNYTTSTAFASASGSSVGVLNVDNAGNVFVGTGGGTGSVSSVGLSMPSAFTVTNSPVTTLGTLTVTGAGTTAQYVRGDGTLGIFPSQGGGGGGTVYYLNGNTAQGTFGGVAMKQLSRAAGTGAAANFTGNVNGAAIATFITDAGDPNQLTIPPGIWVFECYLSESGGGSAHAEIQAVVEKWDGSTITVISTGALEQITNGNVKDLYQFGVTIPTGTTLALTDRIVVQIKIANTNGKTVTLYTEDSNVCSVTTTFANGIASLNGLTATAQTFQNDTNVTITSSGSVHTLGWSGQLSTSRGGTGLGSIGTSLQYLRVNSGATGLEYATFPTIPSVTPSALTETDDTNVTLTLGGSPSTALLQPVSLTLGWTGQLSTSRGGTGLGSIGTSLQYLRVNSGATGLEYATLPTIPTVTPSALTKTDDTNVTLTLGGSPSTALLQATSLTLGWTGQLAVSRGGTGLSSLGTANQLIRVNSGATALEYFTPNYLTSAVTSVSGTGTAFGLTLTGTVTSTGSLTLGGTLAVPVANITATGTPSSTTYLRGDGSWSSITGGSQVVLASDYNNTTTTGYEDVTGLSFAVTNGKTYKWRATIAYTSPSTASLSINGPTTTFNRYRFTLANGGTGNAVSNQTSYNQPASNTTIISGVGTADGILKMSASGTVTIRVRASTVAGITILAGSILEYEEVL